MKNSVSIESGQLLSEILNLNPQLFNFLLNRIGFISRRYGIDEAEVWNAFAAAHLKKPIFFKSVSHLEKLVTKMVSCRCLDIIRRKRRGAEHENAWQSLESAADGQGTSWTDERWEIIKEQLRAGSASGLETMLLERILKEGKVIHQKTLATFLGCSQSKVSRAMRGIRQKLKARLEME